MIKIIIIYYFVYANNNEEKCALPLSRKADAVITGVPRMWYVTLVLI